MVSSVKGKSSHSGNEVNARGDSSSRTEISETSAHGLRISTSGRSSILIRRMIVSVAAACGIAVMFGAPGKADSYPTLRKLLRDIQTAARDAVVEDVESSCSNPRQWLNPAGHSPLSQLPAFDRYNASMLWGTYRPGVYFGMKTRSFPEAMVAGIMWHAGDGRSNVENLRHECREGNGVGPYGWLEHDGKSFGKQEVTDQQAGARITTSWVKPAQLVHAGASDGVGSDVHVAARVEVNPDSEERRSGRHGSLTMYLYVGVDGIGVDDGEAARDRGRLTELKSPADPASSLWLSWKSSSLGEVVVEASASGRVSGGDEDEDKDRDEGGAGLTIAYVGKAGVPMVDLQSYLEKMLSAHRNPRRGDQRDAQVRQPFRLPNFLEPNSDTVLIQVTGEVPFSIDLVFRDASGARHAGAGARGKDPQRQLVAAEAISEWLEDGSNIFSRRFARTFELEERGFEAEDISAAKAALSNLLGGMGYFRGRSEIRGAGADGGNGMSFEASLFSAVPSRSFFPRGFLWDEGFHQLLVSVWDRQLSIDVLGHWLSLMHVHKEGDGTRGGCAGGWLPREQILGDEARRRVPAEFIAQGISVANPPTLLLLVDRLLQGIGSGKSNGMGHDPEIKVYEKDASTTCEAGGDGEGGHIDPTLEFLTRIKAPLDEWMRWLLTTQRPGAQGWGGQDSRSPMGAFQWRGRDPNDDRLNPMTLASGLDDYPRASHPSREEEWHVDVLSWLAMGCDVMKRLSGVVGVRTLPYENLSDELVGGLVDFHWDEDAQAFLDYGKHVGDGAIVEEVLVRCRRADGNFVDVGAIPADIEAGQTICPAGHRFSYALGDGRGGLLVRKRWRGSGPRAQHVLHIGYVSIFPLLLQLLPPDSPALGSLLAHMRDPKELWSAHGLRSLSASDPLYQVGNNPGDEPYWRGHIWVNLNYLALAALRHYGEVEGPFRESCEETYVQLRSNLLRTLLGGYRSTGYFWEQYDDRTGRGLRSHPFTGWTALVVLIMAEIY